jgi:hypothetical protein
MSNNTFQGILRVRVEAQPRMTKAIRMALRESFGDGTGLSRGYNYNCRIAEDVNAVIKEGIEGANGNWFDPNPKIKAQFGKNKHGLAYLTFGLIERESGKRYTLRWEGDSVPTEMIRVAVKHDEGAEIGITLIALNLATANVHETGNKAGLINPPIDKRRNHDTAKDGNPYPRPQRTSHSRMCSADLKRMGI